MIIMTKDDLRKARAWRHPVRILVPMKKGLPMLALDKLDEALIKKAAE